MTTCAESVLAVRGVGLQFTAEFDDGSRAVRFVDARAVRAVVMNEGVEGCGVHYYIAVVAAGQREMQLAFPYTRPRLAVAAPIFREIHNVMLAPSAAASAGSVARAAGSQTPPTTTSLEPQRLSGADR